MAGILTDSYRSLAETTYEERWANIPGFSAYQVSTAGRVRSLTRRVYNYVKPGRFMRQYISNAGYLYLNLVNDEGVRDKHVYVHRLVAQSFIPNPNGYSQINHINYDKEDNRAENLEWVSPQQNILHFRAGELARKYDEKKHRTLANKSIQYIIDHRDEVCTLYNQGLSIKEIAKVTGLGKDKISDILKVYDYL